MASEARGGPRPCPWCPGSPHLGPEVIWGSRALAKAPRRPWPRPQGSGEPRSTPVSAPSQRRWSAWTQSAGTAPPAPPVSVLTVLLQLVTSTLFFFFFPGNYLYICKRRMEIIVSYLKGGCGGYFICLKHMVEWLTIACVIETSVLIITKIQI